MFAKPLSTPITLTDNVSGEQEGISLVATAYAAPTGAAGLETVSVHDLRPGDVIYTNGIRRYQLLTPLDDKRRAMISNNELIIPFINNTYTVKREVIQVAWRHLETWAVTNQPTDIDAAVASFWRGVDAAVAGGLAEAAVEAVDDRYRDMKRTR
jgi:hypothetical protein